MTVSWIMPSLIMAILTTGIIKKVPVFTCFMDGAKEGLKTMYSIAPSLIGLIAAISMLKASGGLDLLIQIMSPFTDLLGIPKEVSPLFILKPISGSGSLAMLEQISADNGADSVISKIAAVMTGSTETTFYCIAVYFGATNIKKTGYTVPCALLGDFASMMAACFTVLLSSGKA